MGFYADFIAKRLPPHLRNIAFQVKAKYGSDVDWLLLFNDTFVTQGASKDRRMKLNALTLTPNPSLLKL